MKTCTATLVVLLGSSLAFVPSIPRRNVAVSRVDAGRPTPTHSDTTLPLYSASKARPIFPTPHVTSSTPIAAESSLSKNILEARFRAVEIQIASECATDYIAYLQEVVHVSRSFLQEDSSSAPTEQDNEEQVREYLVNIESAIAQAQEYQQELSEMADGVKTYLMFATAMQNDEHRDGTTTAAEQDYTIQQLDSSTWLQELDETVEAGRDFLDYLQKVTSVVEHYLVQPNLRGIEEFMPPSHPQRVKSDAVSWKLPVAPALEVVTTSKHDASTSQRLMPKKRIVITNSTGMDVLERSVGRSTAVSSTGSGYLSSLKSSSTMLKTVSNDNLEYLDSVVAEHANMNGAGPFTGYLDTTPPSEFQDPTVPRTIKSRMSPYLMPRDVIDSSPGIVNSMPRKKSLRERTMSRSAVQGESSLEDESSSAQQGAQDALSPTVSSDWSETEPTTASGNAVPTTTENDIPAMFTGRPMTTSESNILQEEPVAARESHNLEALQSPSAVSSTSRLDELSSSYMENVGPSFPSSRKDEAKTEPRPVASPTVVGEPISSFEDATAGQNLETQATSAVSQIYSGDESVSPLNARPVSSESSRNQVAGTESVSVFSDGAAAAEASTSLKETGNVGTTSSFEDAESTTKYTLPSVKAARNEALLSYLDQMSTRKVASRRSQREKSKSAVSAAVSKSRSSKDAQLPPDVSRSEAQSSSSETVTVASNANARNEQRAPNVDSQPSEHAEAIVSGASNDQPAQGSSTSPLQYASTTSPPEHASLPSENTVDSSTYSSREEGATESSVRGILNQVSPAQGVAASRFVDPTPIQMVPTKIGSESVSSATLPLDSSLEASAVDSYAEERTYSTDTRFDTNPGSSYQDQANSLSQQSASGYANAPPDSISSYQNQVSQVNEPVDWSSAAGQPSTTDPANYGRTDWLQSDDRFSPSSVQRRANPNGVITGNDIYPYQDPASSPNNVHLDATSSYPETTSYNQVEPRQQTVDNSNLPAYQVPFSMTDSLARDSNERGPEIARAYEEGRPLYNGGTGASMSSNDVSQYPVTTGSYTETSTGYFGQGTTQAQPPPSRGTMDGNGRGRFSNPFTKKREETVRSSSPRQGNEESKKDRDGRNGKKGFFAGFGSFLRRKPEAAKKEYQSQPTQQFALEEPAENFFFAKLDPPEGIQRNGMESARPKSPSLGEKFKEKLRRVSEMNPLNMFGRGRVVTDDKGYEVEEPEFSISEAFEILWGRLAMIFIVAGLAIELHTGTTFPAQLASVVQVYSDSMEELNGVKEQLVQSSAGMQIQKALKEAGASKLEQSIHDGVMKAYSGGAEQLSTLRYQLQASPRTSVVQKVLQDARMTVESTIDDNVAATVAPSDSATTGIPPGPSRESTSIEQPLQDANAPPPAKEAPNMVSEAKSIAPVGSTQTLEPLPREYGEASVGGQESKLLSRETPSVDSTFPAASTSSTIETATDTDSTGPDLSEWSF